MLGNKLKFAIGILVITLTLGYLVYGGVKSSMMYYLTVDELVDRIPGVYDERIRVSGTVVDGTIKRDEDGSLRFSIQEGGYAIDVDYIGVVPDIFADGVEAIVEGRYTSEDVFRADVLMAKCPTKYEEDPEYAGYGYYTN